jgi:hypothetical protein
MCLPLSFEIETFNRAATVLTSSGRWSMPSISLAVGDSCDADGTG